MRALRPHPAWLAALPLLALACFDPPKIDPGPRILDDFETDTPTWTRFSPWTCAGLTGDEPSAPASAAAADGGTGSTGGVVDCTIEPPGDGDSQALFATFALADPPDGVRQHPAAEIVSQTAAGSTVDLNGFTQLVFFAILGNTPALPAGTKVYVELGCSTYPLDLYAWNLVTADLMTGDWVRVPLTLADFQVETSMHNQACLAQVDSLRFVIVPNVDDGQSASGTFQLDNIKLQN